MNQREAVTLIADAVPRATGVWADIGAGDGTFTRALVELLGPGSRIYAVDRSSRALATIARWKTQSGANVVPVEADLTSAFELPGAPPEGLSGMLLANALHFIQDQEIVLSRLVQRVRFGGRVVIVEYDRRDGNRWVPYPIPRTTFPRLAEQLGLSAARVTMRRPSKFGGDLYVAVADRR